MARTILLADDSPTIRKIVELTFHDTDIRVESTASGSEALARLETVRPDVVLADVVMPEPTGYDICRRIKESDRPVPVLLLAGTFEPFDLQQARDCGADDHLVKPFESATLVEKIERLLRAPAASRLEVQQVIDDLVEEHGEVASRVARPRSAEPSPRVPLTPAEIDALARAVVERLAERVVREIAAEVVPELARAIIREQLEEITREKP
jgi:CheY-like chemotaxis protein